MKKISLLVLSLICIGITLNAQTQKETKPIIAATNMNILYRGIDNPISIATDGISDEYLYAEITHGKGKLKKVGKCEYSVSVDYGTYEQTMTIDCVDKDGTTYQKDTLIITNNNAIEISVYAEINNKKNYLGSTYFRVKDIKQPTAQINKSEGGKIDKDALLKNPYIKVEAEDFNLDFSLEYKVIGFQMTFNTRKNADAPCVSRDEKFTPEMIAKIKTLKKGDKIYIEGIRVAGTDGEKSPSNPQMIFTIR